MQTFNITLTLAEVNLVLQGLGNLPFIYVFELIEKVKKQAENQVHLSSNEEKNEC